MAVGIEDFPSRDSDINRLSGIVPKAGEEYQPADPETLARVSRFEIGRSALENLGLRVAVINGDEVLIEPLQVGVLHYPPVKVTGVPRNT